MQNIEFIPDATANDFIVFCDDIKRIASWRRLFSDGCKISAIRIWPLFWNIDAPDFVIDAAQKLIRCDVSIKDSRPLLFHAVEGWAIDSRLTSYKKIWKCRHIERFGVPTRHRGPEIRYESPLGVRFATCIIDMESIFNVALSMLMKLDLTAWIVVTSHHQTPAEFIADQFSAAYETDKASIPETHVDWGRVIHNAATRGDLIMKRTDYPGRGTKALDCFGHKEHVAKLWRALQQ